MFHCDFFNTLTISLASLIASCHLCAQGSTDINTLLTGGGSPQLTPVQNTMIAAPPAANTSSTTSTQEGYTSAPGPWGNLVGDYIFLEAPSSLIENFALPSIQPRWTFPLAFKPKLEGFFNEAGLTPEQIASLMLPQAQVTEGDLLHLLPSVSLVEQMTPQVRAHIYSELGKLPENEYCQDPVLITGVSVQEWYRTSKLRRDLIDKIEQLSYMRGETRAFSDIPVLLNHAQSDSEARAIFKACTRTRSLMVRLKIESSTNIPELISYWSFGVGIRRKDIEPLMRSIADSSTLHDLGMVHILPALPRKLLYTYPSLDMAKNGQLPDCHWTSLNFYNFDASQYLLDSRLATSQVLENFLPVEAPYHFGDILFFLDSLTGDAFHSCVYLADTLVYTKNGRNVLSPWIIMKLEDVKKVYLFRDNGRVQGFRRKDIETARRESAN
jgi:hypothetical protein